MNEEMKVVLKIGDAKVVLDMDPALQILKLLWAQHVQLLRYDYEKDPTTGNYGYVYRIKTMEQSDMALEYLSPTNYVAYCHNGDTK